MNNTTKRIIRAKEANRREQLVPQEEVNNPWRKDLAAKLSLKKCIGKKSV